MLPTGASAYPLDLSAWRMAGFDLARVHPSCAAQQGVGHRRLRR